MKKYTLLGHVFELDENAYHFLVRYVERIEQYVKKNSIGADIFDDIKYSLIEKLYASSSPIAEKEVIEIANTLGEPEVMFGDAEEEGVDLSPKKNNILNREKPVIWGVCYWLAKSMNIPVIVMRIIFLILLLANGIGAIIYILVALFVPFKDKKKTTGIVGSLLFEIVRILFWLIILGITLPLTFSSLAVRGIISFTPVIENQSITSRIPQYMYIVGALISIALLLLTIGAVGSLFKQKRLPKSLGLLSFVVLIVGGVVTAGIIYRSVVQVITHKAVVEQQVSFSGSDLSGDRISIDMTNITHYSTTWPYVGIGNADVRIIRTEGSDINVQIKTTVRGESDEQALDTASKLNSLIITGDANNIIISRPEKIFSSIVPLAGPQKSVIIAIPANIEVYINKDRRTNMYVQSDGLGKGYCAAKVYVYNPKFDEFTCKNNSGEVFYNLDEPNGIEELQGLDSVPPLYSE